MLDHSPRLDLERGGVREPTRFGHAQQLDIGVPVPPLGAGPFVFDTAEQHKIRVSVVTRGLSHPWAIAFLPDGGMLVTERSQVQAAVQAAREAPGTVVIDFRVEQEDTVFPMVPAGADLHAMIRRPKPVIEAPVEVEW